MDKLAVLRHYFGHRSFRSGQEALIDALLTGRDALGIMPTGGGKSLCYQVPALTMDGVTLVISPLISLMRDQVLALKNAGVSAAYINSSLTPEQLGLVYRRAEGGAYKIIYVSPERLESPAFLALAMRLKLALVAVDEAHCISQWGQDFRPSYLKIADFLAQLPHRPPVGAFTATATKAVRRDIVDKLALRAPEVLVTGFDRPNLYFEVMPMQAVQKSAALQNLLCKRRGKCGIVYCSTRSAVERVHADLELAGFSAGRYHAGLSEQERAQAQEDFQFDRKDIMVATNAFGMGIDKSNVRFVIHYNMPLSLEAYYQEAGRAGRDGGRGDCILLFAPGDVKTAKFLIENGGEHDDLSPTQQQARLQHDLRRLTAMERYCQTGDCLRRHILHYFGEEFGDNCGNCVSCLRRYREQDVTREAQMLLSCAVRAKRALGRACAGEVLADILYGADVPEALRGLTTYGLLSDSSMAQIMTCLDHLQKQGYLIPEGDGLIPSDTGNAVLFDGAQVRMPVERADGEAAIPRHREQELEGEQLLLFQRLEKARAALARRQSVPPYTVCSDATLVEMVLRRPQCEEELADIDGMGKQRAHRCARAFLGVLTDLSEV